jgi:uncharacterized protein YllA (UPF0747 family)
VLQARPCGKLPELEEAKPAIGKLDRAPLEQESHGALLSLGPEQVLKVEPAAKLTVRESTAALSVNLLKNEDAPTKVTAASADGDKVIAANKDAAKHTFPDMFKQIKFISFRG